MDWQSIETAPKDGTWVLLLIPESCQDSNRPKPWVEAAYWEKDMREEWVDVSPNTRKLKWQDHSHWSCYETPTHWAPMPTPP